MTASRRRSSRLDADTVRRIRTSLKPPRELAAEYGIAQSYVYKLIHRQNWRDILPFGRHRATSGDVAMTAMQRVIHEIRSGPVTTRDIADALDLPMAQVATYLGRLKRVGRVVASAPIRKGTAGRPARLWRATA